MRHGWLKGFITGSLAVGALLGTQLRTPQDEQRATVAAVQITRDSALVKSCFGAQCDYHKAETLLRTAAKHARDLGDKTLQQDLVAAAEAVNKLGVTTTNLAITNRDKTNFETLTEIELRTYANSVKRLEDYLLIVDHQGWDQETRRVIEQGAAPTLINAAQTLDRIGDKRQEYHDLAKRFNRLAGRIASHS
jgi:hypothetical protein